MYEPLTHSETYMMSTISDMSEDNYGGTASLHHPSGGNYSDVSRQNSSRESRPLIRPQDRNLLHTISGVLHSQVNCMLFGVACSKYNIVYDRFMARTRRKLFVACPYQNAAFWQRHVA